MKKLVYFLFLISGGAIAQETLQSVTNNGAETTNRVGLDNGAWVQHRNLKVYGLTHGYQDPFIVQGNLDGSAAVLEDGGLRFDRSYDIFEEDGSSLIMVYPPSGIPYIRRYGSDFTIFKIWSPTASRQAYESTLALVNGDNEEEFLDLYNMNYPSNSSFGIRLQKRGTGNYKKFHFEYSDGTELYKVLSLAPDTTAVFHGRVGIGTEATEYQLAVAGSVVAESIDVKLQTAWPDYVFKEGYQRLDLKELDQFIQENGTLPEVPSAETVALDGINLGQMDAILLKKVEEITLYLIEHQKKLELLEKENQELRQKLKNLQNAN
ncbi:hypothetical protein LV84_01353 [Algoriphagus ratkowskyi]|uniref:SlyX family protein n=1 Tax=Algoriphagus ratkowskyi TaxID=57028 RepID=A0A2W7T7W2_9BACT|nr:hypothetical protein [Algoriphagus ratkowskyi]PZX59322.1 hypothetical protein LV84_01353 [Algoriphagus ratkowskyi]TXD77411.1 SlyX family protein [Algoriphagus ratkowskyi]